MEQYQFSFTWWMFRLITLVEVAAIIYLFSTTWKLHKCMSNTRKLMQELLTAKRSSESRHQSMEDAEQKLTDLHELHSFKGPKDDFS